MLERSSPKSILDLHSLNKAPSLSPAQARAETLVSSFVDSVTDGYSLAAMVGGGLAYRLGRVGTLALGSRLFNVGTGISPPLQALIRYGSVGIGFGAEVFTFEAEQRALRVVVGGADPAVLNWSGENGLGRGLVGTALSLGPLKGMGVLVQGQNPILQHLFQDGAMVLAHNISSAIGITERPSESFAEQMVNAEATLWQMDAGMRLLHGAAPFLSQMERSLDLALKSQGMFLFSKNPPPLSLLTRMMTKGIPLTALGTGLAALLGSSDAQAAVERMSSGGFNALEAGLTVFALGMIFSRMADWVKNLWKRPEPPLVNPEPLNRSDLSKGPEESAEIKLFPLSVCRKFAHRRRWDFLMVMGRVLREAPEPVVRDFIDQHLPQNPLTQLTWLENYRVEAGKEILADPEAFIRKATSEGSFSKEQLLEIRTKAAEVLYGLGEKKKAMDYLHQVFSHLTQGVPWVEFYPQDEYGNFILMEPPHKRTFFSLIGKDIYPYFLGSLDPHLGIGQKLVQEYHEEKKKLLPRDPSMVKKNFHQGWISLIFVHFLRETDRIELAKEMAEAHGKEKLISELRGLLKESHNAPVAARLLDHLDPGWDRPLHKLKIQTTKKKGAKTDPTLPTLIALGAGAAALLGDGTAHAAAEAVANSASHGITGFLAALAIAAGGLAMAIYSKGKETPPLKELIEAARKNDDDALRTLGEMAKTDHQRANVALFNLAIYNQNQRAFDLLVEAAREGNGEATAQLGKVAILLPSREEAVVNALGEIAKTRPDLALRRLKGFAKYDGSQLALEKLRELSKTLPSAADEVYFIENPKKERALWAQMPELELKEKRERVERIREIICEFKLGKILSPLLEDIPGGYRRKIFPKDSKEAPKASGAKEDNFFSLVKTKS